MALSDLVIPTESFSVGNTSITVRGLNASDIAFLFLNDREAVEQFVNKWQEQGNEPSPAFVNELLVEMPDLVAKTIACACDEPDAWQNAKRIPVPQQLLMLNAIGALTFKEVGVKKFMEAALLMVQAVVQAGKEMAPTGTGG